ncbi:urea transport system permease protein [Propionibacterium cyclohexanicum]|uniref:Urea transport system permease protein n=1 Tax=Propionibacterium cyclohexanicum TaxID=64702 RepID=A0A1H9RN51_9ACTN|nr:urea ABC transporter permease subunit UrtB [Propionibacterium cyclohexanicum]SER73503.1 urea transport system permease protein [Propionibacterium cyclohexanicum]
MDVVVGQLLAGLSVGSVLLLAAVGMSLTFGQMGIINMAHGEFIMIGAYTVYMVQQFVSVAALSYVIAIPCAFLLAAAVGVLLEQGVLQFMYRRPLDTLLVTFGVSLILQQAARDIFGAPAVAINIPEFLSGHVSLLGAAIPVSRILIIVLAMVLVLLVSWLLKATQVGRRMRAVTVNRELAEVSGIPTRRTDRLTFALGSGLAGIAGVAITLIGSTTPTLGSNYIVYAFLVVVAGGLSSIWGAVIAAVALGIVQSAIAFGTTQSIATWVSFLLVVLFLQWRPQGIFSLKTRSLA